jgi:hypothetical protein
LSWAFVVCGVSMARRPCLDCGRLCDGTRCLSCASARNRAKDVARGNRHARGYDSTHDAIRTALLTTLAPGAPCDRCWQPMLRTQALDAAHPHDRPLRTHPDSRADHLEHAHCNRAARD